MERSCRNFQPYSSNKMFQAIIASPNRYFTENSRWVPLSKFVYGMYRQRNVTKEVQFTSRQLRLVPGCFASQWIRWTPSERLSTPSSNMSEILLSLTNRKCTFPSESICFQWIIYTWQDLTPLDFRFSDGKQRDTTGFQSTVFENPQNIVRDS